MTISSDSAKRRNRDRSSLTSASATWRTRRPVPGEPVRGFSFRDDREDLDGFARDVIEHPHFPDPEAILRLAHAPQPFDPALAHPGGLVPQVPFEGVPHLGAAMGRQRPESLGRRGGQNDRVRHYSQTMAILGTAVKRHRLTAVSYGKWTTRSGGGSAGARLRSHSCRRTDRRRGHPVFRAQPTTATAGPTRPRWLIAARRREPAEHPRARARDSRARRRGA